MDLKIVPFTFMLISSLCVLSPLPMRPLHSEAQPRVCARLVAESCLTLCNPTDSNPPDSSVHGIFQAGILEWVAISSSRGSSQPRDGTLISCVSCSGRRILYQRATWEAQPSNTQPLNPFWSEQWAGLMPLAYEAVGHDLILLLQTVLGMSRDLPIR